MLDHVNKVVKFMVFSDLVLFSGWGLVSPIFAIFVIGNIEGATLTIVGISSAVYWLARAVVQPGVAWALDRRKGEKDDFWTLLLSLLVIAISSFILAVVKTPTGLYLVQVLHGMSYGIYSVAWPAIFSRHMDKEGVAFDWSLDRASIGVSVAITSIAGAKLAELVGFQTVFVITGVASILSALILFAVPKLILPKDTGKPTKVKAARTHRKHKSRSTVGL